MSTQVVEAIIVYSLLAAALFVLWIAYLNSAIALHRQERLKAACEIRGRRLTQERADRFKRHDSWLEWLAQSWWNHFVNHRKYGKNIAARKPIEINAQAVIRLDAEHAKRVAEPQMQPTS